MRRMNMKQFLKSVLIKYRIFKQVIPLFTNIINILSGMFLCRAVKTEKYLHWCYLNDGKNIHPPIKCHQKYSWEFVKDYVRSGKTDKMISFCILFLINDNDYDKFSFIHQVDSIYMNFSNAFYLKY